MRLYNSLRSAQVLHKHMILNFILHKALIPTRIEPFSQQLGSHSNLMGNYSKWLQLANPNLTKANTWYKQIDKKKYKYG